MSFLIILVSTLSFFSKSIQFYKFVMKNTTTFTDCLKLYTSIKLTEAE